MPTDYSEWLSAFATLIAAFMGAWFAFKLQDRAKYREEMKANVAAGNRALFNVLRQANSLKLIQRDHLDGYRDHPGRHLMVQPLPRQAHEDTKLDLRELSFMVAPKHQDILFKLIIEESRYAEAIKTLNMLSEFRIQVQGAVARAGIEHGREYTGEALRTAMGDFAYHQLRTLTDALYFHVDRTIATTMEVKEALRASLEEMYPKAKFLNFELVEGEERELGENQAR